MLHNNLTKNLVVTRHEIFYGKSVKNEKKYVPKSVKFLDNFLKKSIFLGIFFGSGKEFGVLFKVNKVF